MKPNELWEETGRMLERAQREKVTAAQARDCLGTWLQQKAAGGEPADLTVETVWALGDDNSELPEELCKLLGLELGSDYGDIFNAMYFFQHPAH